MQIGLVGLGKMGYPLALNLKQNHEVVAFDTNQALTSQINGEGIKSVQSLKELTASLTTPRLIWLMVPAGHIVDLVIDELLPNLDKGDILIDGGNSNFNDTLRRNGKVGAAGIEFLDCGTSGGVEGARHGVCAMIGGKKEIFDYCEPLFRSISIPGGCLYCGASGSGHFVKMVHNGIEYGMMQAIAEGFSMLHNGGYDLDMKSIAQLWNRGSVIRGWLMELSANALTKDARLEGIKGIAHASGEAQWMIDAAMQKKVSVPVIAMSLMMRFQSQDAENFSAKMVAALRNEFGGHAVEKSE